MTTTVNRDQIHPAPTLAEVIAAGRGRRLGRVRFVPPRVPVVREAAVQQVGLGEWFGDESEQPAEAAGIADIPDITAADTAADTAPVADEPTTSGRRRRRKAKRTIDQTDRTGQTDQTGQAAAEPVREGTAATADTGEQAGLTGPAQPHEREPIDTAAADTTDAADAGDIGDTADELPESGDVVLTVRPGYGPDHAARLRETTALITEAVPMHPYAAVAPGEPQEETSRVVVAKLREVEAARRRLREVEEQELLRRRELVAAEAELDAELIRMRARIEALALKQRSGVNGINGINGAGWGGGALLSVDQMGEVMALLRQHAG